MGTPIDGGRVAQKQRTRSAILLACRSLLESGERVTMPAVAEAAVVSEATAYRYFPDIVSLLREATRSTWPDVAQALEPVTACTDPAQRVAYAAEVLMRHVLAYESGVRATIAATISDPGSVQVTRPGYRFTLIDAALAPLEHADPPVDADVLARLRLDLAVVVSAEALFTLTDLCGLPAEQAIASAARTAALITRATLDAAAPRGT